MNKNSNQITTLDAQGLQKEDTFQNIFKDHDFQDESLVSKLWIITKELGNKLITELRSSRLLQAASVLFIVGIGICAYTVVRLVQDSHLVCLDADQVISAKSRDYKEYQSFLQENGVSSYSDQADQANRDAQFNQASLVNQTTLASTEAIDDVSVSKNQIATNQDDTIIRVDVSGAVKKPGVYSVGIDARIGDVIAKAGGVSVQANAQQVAQVLNLAQKVRDGQKVYVPFAGEELQEVLKRQISQTNSNSEQSLQNGSDQIGIQTGLAETDDFFLQGNQIEAKTQTEGQESKKVNDSQASRVSINTALAAELMSLKGIGEKRAADIIAGRPYNTISELVEKKVLTQSIFASIEDELRL